MRKLTINDMHTLASEHKGKCLSKEYINNSTKLEWECELHHQWFSIPNNIKKGSWCPKCSNRIRATKKTKHTIEEMREFAQNKGGRCLSDKYINCDKKLVWKCDKSHIWEATPYSVIFSKNPTWCPVCGGSFILNIESMKQLAKEKDGECLSTVYTNNNTKLLWRCKSLHEWQATPASAKNGWWCPFCSGKAKRTIENMREIASTKGGECLSDKYTNLRTKLLWRCKEHHEWHAIPHHVIDGHWCPHCLNYTNEEIIRNIFEEIFTVRFIKTRPEWLMGKNKRLLELDGYNDELKLAFEYHGEQHFNGNNYFHKLKTNREESFKKAQENDTLKRLLCKKNNVKLIEIPHTVNPKKYKEYITNQLKLSGVVV